MSDFRTIAVVTAALRRLVLGAVQADLPGADVTTLRPAEPGVVSGIPDLGVNLYLYETAPIASLRNNSLPARRNDGSVAERPVAALELHYLFSFYGNDANLEPQRLMGSTVARLTAEPLLTRKRVEDTLADPLTPFLAGSDLPEQVDSVKFTPLSLSLEEMSRVWSVFFQTRYALSMAWRASAIFIEPQLRVAPSLPVREPLLFAIPIREPRITDVLAAAGKDAPILPGADIVIRGERLRADLLEILVGGNVVAPDSVSDERIDLTLPAGLAAGPQSLQVRHLLAFGDPPMPHHGFDSNPGAFILHPHIAQSGGNYEIAVTNVSGTGTDPRSATITPTLTSAAGKTQQITLELLDTATATVRRTFFATPLTADTTTPSFPVTNLPAGTYLARVRINGADSPLDLDPNPASPTFGKAIAPTLTIP
jgi:hypothetical protein